MILSKFRVFQLHSGPIGIPRGPLMAYFTMDNDNSLFKEDYEDTLHLIFQSYMIFSIVLAFITRLFKSLR